MFVKELEITLENGMKISGELDLPERQGQWKTIILFHGSGPSDRHATVESMGGIVSRNFDLLSEGFEMCIRDRKRETMQKDTGKNAWSICRKGQACHWQNGRRK